MRIRVWQLVSELKEEPAFIIERCRELMFTVSGRFSILTPGEADRVREAVEAFRREEAERKKNERKIVYAPGMSPEELKKAEEEKKARIAAARAARTRPAPSAITGPAPKAPAGPRGPAPTGPTAPAVAAGPAADKEAGKPKDGRKKTRDDIKVKPAKAIKGKKGPGIPDVDEVVVPEFTGIAALPGIHRLTRGSRIKKRTAEPLNNSRVEIALPITLRDLSQQLGIKLNDIMFKLMKHGHMLTVNSLVSEELVELIALEFDREVGLRREKDASELFEEQAQKAEDASEGEGTVRAPIVTFLGHVDHGKTSLLDHIRKTKVVDREAGGITQHIGAYHIDRDGVQVTFLDTPGHEAFTALRARGAQLTDIAVLVVAADDGVMPQTKEAIAHAKAAKVPIVVAINKIDKAQADVMRVKQQLMDYDLVAEEWGGTTPCVPVSATKGTGVDELLETIMLVAEMEELKAHPESPARGAIIEARKDDRLGCIATLLVQDGTLKKGDYLVVGPCFCRVRDIRNWVGKSIPEAGPSYPVEVWGLSEVPSPGDKFIVVDSLEKAREIAQEKSDEQRRASMVERKRTTLQDFLKGVSEDTKELPIILKTDVNGTREVLETTIEKLSTKRARVQLVHTAVGGINIADVQLADASNAIIIGFSVIPDNNARALAEQLKIEVRTYSIIYNLVDDLKTALQGLLEPIRNEVVTARIEVRQIFRITKVGTVAGCFVREGTVSRSEKIRVIRDNVVIYSGSIDALKRFKDDVKEVREGYECGIRIAGYDDLKEGDHFETYKVELSYPALDE